MPRTRRAEWIDDATDACCDADRTLFRVATAVTGDGPLRVVESGLLVCPAHLLAAVYAGDDPNTGSTVFPVADHPLRDRPPVAVR